MNDTRVTMITHLVQAVAAISSLTLLAALHIISGGEALGGILAAAGVTTFSQLVTNLVLSSRNALSATTHALVAQSDPTTTHVDVNASEKPAEGG